MQRRVQTHKRNVPDSTSLSHAEWHNRQDARGTLSLDFKTGYIGVGRHASGRTRRRWGTPPREHIEAWRTVSWDRKCRLSEAKHVNTQRHRTHQEHDWFPAMRWALVTQRGRGTPPLLYTIKRWLSLWGSKSQHKALYYGRAMQFCTLLSVPLVKCTLSKTGSKLQSKPDYATPHDTVKL